MLTGILNINKPLNLTSHDVVKEVRKILKIKKIGHTGTLDPAATGVLPLCINKATKLIQYLPSDKQYVAEITLGITTKTHDRDGEIISKQAVKFDKELVLNTLNEFVGEIQQQVPATSAVHYKGEKLYKYAHNGIEITDLPFKTVKIYNIEYLKSSHENKENPVITIKVDCESGTYIRSIANDLGTKLGCGAFLSGLTRTRAANLNIENSITLEELANAVEQNTIENLLTSPVDIIKLPSLQIGFGQIKRLSHGQYIRLLKDTFNDKEKIILSDKNKNIVAVGEYNKKELSIYPINVLLSN